jgi:hypothetical protein
MNFKLKNQDNLIILRTTRHLGEKNNHKKNACVDERGLDASVDTGVGQVSADVLIIIQLSHMIPVDEVLNPARFAAGVGRAQIGGRLTNPHVPLLNPLAIFDEECLIAVLVQFLLFDGCNIPLLLLVDCVHLVSHLQVI